MAVGDFNVVRCQDERLGGNPIHLPDVIDFNDMISVNGPVDGGYSRSKYT